MNVQEYNARLFFGAYLDGEETGAFLAAKYGSKILPS
jgi:hypothetical protein